MGKVASGLLSVVGLGGAPKTKKPAPVEAAKPVADIKDDVADAAGKKARQSLYSTPGGASGEELNPDQVKRRPTLLGN